MHTHESPESCKQNISGCNFGKSWFNNFKSYLMMSWRTDDKIMRYFPTKNVVKGILQEAKARGGRDKKGKEYENCDEGGFGGFRGGR